MPLDTRYVVGININDYFVDKDTGLPLAGGTIEFFRDSARNVGKFAYQLTGSPPNYTYTPLPNPITLSSVGTVDNGLGTNVAVYYYPYDENGDLDLYYIVVKDSDGNPQLIREGWPNIGASTSPTGQVSGDTDNQISNSQFVDILFNDAYGVNLPILGAVSNMEFPIAPGWSLIVSSSGAASIDVGRIAIQGSLNINTNPPYALTVLPNGATISSIKLRQRMYFNPDIWASSFLSGFMLIASLDSLSHSVEMTYAPSISAAPQTVILASTGITGYTSAANVIQLNPGVNTSAPPAGYVDIDILLPKTGFIAISSIQVLPVLDIASVAAYKQDTVNRQKDHLFHYYNPLIQSIPVPSLSEGWDFKMNPAQFGSTQPVKIGASNYIWDQTIGWQSADNLISAQRDLAGRLKITTAATGQFALVQYLSVEQMKVLLSNGWSTLINAYTDNLSGAPGSVSFYYTTDATIPDINVGTNLSLVSTIDLNGKPITFNGNWTELSNPLLGTNQFTIPYNSVSTTSSIALNGWSTPLFGVSSTATFCAIVVGFSSLPATNIYFDSISVTPGSLAVPFASVSLQTTLAQMQQYYETTYPPGIAPGTIGVPSSFNVLVRDQGITLGLYTGDLLDLSYYWRQLKRSDAYIFTTYSTISSAPNNMRTVLYEAGVIAYSNEVALTAHFLFLFRNKGQILWESTNPVTFAVAPFAGFFKGFGVMHLVADARFGIVN